MISFRVYGNYYGNKYYGDNYKLQPIDGVDFVTFMHDIEYKTCGGNNRFSDRKISPRMKYILATQKITIAGKLVAYLAIYIYSTLYAKFIRESFIGKILEKKGILRDSKDEYNSFMKNQNKCKKFAIEKIRSWDTDKKDFYVDLYNNLWSF